MFRFAAFKLTKFLQLVSKESRLSTSTRREKMYKLRAFALHRSKVNSVKCVYTIILLFITTVSVRTDGHTCRACTTGFADPVRTWLGTSSCCYLRKRKKTISSMFVFSFFTNDENAIDRQTRSTSLIQVLKSAIVKVSSVERISRLKRD